MCGSGRGPAVLGASCEPARARAGYTPPAACTAPCRGGAGSVAEGSAGASSSRFASAAANSIAVAANPSGALPAVATSQAEAVGTGTAGLFGRSRTEANSAAVAIGATADASAGATATTRGRSKAQAAALSGALGKASAKGFAQADSPSTDAGVPAVGQGHRRRSQCGRRRAGQGARAPGGHTDRHPQHAGAAQRSVERHASCRGRRGLGIHVVRLAHHKHRRTRLMATPSAGVKRLGRMCTGLCAQPASSLPDSHAGM
jgi:hypothetical protein